MNRSTMETDYKISYCVSTPMTKSEQGVATSILSSAKKKNSVQGITGYRLFSNEVRKSIIAANPGRSFGDISRLVGAEWRNLPLLRKMDYKEQAKRQNEEAKKAQAQLKLMSKGIPQSPPVTSGCFDSSSLRTEIVIKEEPIDVSEDPTPSTLDHDYFLPITDSYQSCSTPVIKEVFTVVKTEPMEESQQITSNCTTTTENKRQRSEMADDAIQITTNGRTTKPSSRKSAENYNILELTESKPIDKDAAISKTDSSKDSFDVYGEYIAAKLRNLDLKSCTYVKKAFSDILFNAELGKFK